MLLLLTLAAAAPSVAPPPATVELQADGLRLSRKGDVAEGGEKPAPTVNSESAYDAWSRELLRQEDRRADLAAADALLADYAPLVADCALKAGAAVGAQASAKVTFGSANGVLSVAVVSGGDERLSTCLGSVLHKRQTGILLHPVGGTQEKGGSNPSVSPTWSFTLTAPPERVPTHAMDIEQSVAGVRFRSDPAAMMTASQLQTTRNVTTWHRVLDDNVRFMGIPCTLLFLGHPDHGVVAARIRVSGDAFAFRVKESLKDRFGPARYDNTFKAWYWRGDRYAYIAQHVPDSTTEEFVIMDMEAGLASGVARALPGDRNPGDPTTNQRLPRILSDD